MFHGLEPLTSHVFSAISEERVHPGVLKYAYVPMLGFNPLLWTECLAEWLRPKTMITVATIFLCLPFAFAMLHLWH